MISWQRKILASLSANADHTSLSLWTRVCSRPPTKWFITERKSIKQRTSFCGSGMMTFLLVEEITWHLSIPFLWGSRLSVGCRPEVYLGHIPLPWHIAVFLTKGLWLTPSATHLYWNSSLLIRGPLRDRLMWEGTLKVNGLPLSWHVDSWFSFPWCMTEHHLWSLWG